MPMQLLKPSIDKRTEDLFNAAFCGNEHYQKFMELIGNGQVNDDLKFELENTVILLTKQIVENSYVTGFSEGFNLLRSKNIISA